MSMTIGSVPKNITRQRYVELLEACGFKASEVKSVEFAADGVYVTAFALDEEGRKIVDVTSDSFAKHRIFVPVVESDSSPETTHGSLGYRPRPLTVAEAVEGAGRASEVIRSTGTTVSAAAVQA